MIKLETYSNVTQDEYYWKQCRDRYNQSIPGRPVIYSNNANTSLATVNNILTITITANETLKAANITILGFTHVMNVSGAVASADVTVLQDSAEGDVSFNITAFDLAGNSFTANQTQLNSSNVTIDTSSPILENLIVYSNHHNMSLARIGNNVIITLNVTESLQNATIEILNNTAINMTVMMTLQMQPRSHKTLQMDL